MRGSSFVSEISGAMKLLHSMTLETTGNYASISKCFFSKCSSDSYGCIRLDNNITSLMVKRCIFSRCVSTTTHTISFVHSCACFCFVGETCSVSRVCFDRCKGIGHSPTFFSRCSSDNVFEMSSTVNPTESMPQASAAFFLDLGQQRLSHTNTSHGAFGGYGVGGVVNRADNATWRYSQFVNGVSLFKYAIAFATASQERTFMSFCNAVGMEAPVMLFSIDSNGPFNMSNVVVVDCRAPKLLSKYNGIDVPEYALVECASNVEFELQPSIIAIGLIPPLISIGTTWYPCPPFTDRQLPQRKTLDCLKQIVVIQLSME